MADEATRSRLGRGLAALIGDVGEESQSAERTKAQRRLPIEFLRPNPRNPRRAFAESELAELAASVHEHGIIQPILVRALRGAHDAYEIIAGERRWRAAQRAGLLKVPVVVRDIPDDRLLAVALIENIQRENLNPIEEAHAYRRLADDHQLTQEQIADAVGKDRSSIANYVRLLKLPQEVRANVGSGALSMGHARALLGLPDETSQLRVARDIVARSLSVRETEALVKRASEPVTIKPAADKDVHTRAAEERLRFALGARVRIVRKRKGGQIEIEFGTEEELQRVFEMLTDGK
jgi:ParB family transcriptional regulator, chromosome partitioning protein